MESPTSALFFTPRGRGYFREKMTEETLLPIFDLFLRDLDEVKVGVIENLSKFLKILSPDTRKNYLTVLEELQQPKVNWRFRRLVAKQLGDIAELFSSETVTTTILPVVLKLLLDPVAAVRKALFPQLPQIIQILSPSSRPTITVSFAQTSPSSSTLAPAPRSRAVSASQIQQQQLELSRKQFFNFLKELPKNASYSNRLGFCQLCGHSIGILEKNLFEEIFLVPVLELIRDKVPNVRLSTAHALQKIKNHEYYAEDERIINALGELKSDQDPEVSLKAGGNIPLRKKKHTKN